MKGIRELAVFFGSSFLMHLIWENAQIPLFDWGEASLWDVFAMCLFATATGDMLFILTLYLTVAVTHKKLWWLSDRAAYSHPATWSYSSSWVYCWPSALSFECVPSRVGDTVRCR